MPGLATPAAGHQKPSPAAFTAEQRTASSSPGKIACPHRSITTAQHALSPWHFTCGIELAFIKRSLSTPHHGFPRKHKEMASRQRKETRKDYLLGPRTNPSDGRATCYLADRDIPTQGRLGGRTGRAFLESAAEGLVGAPDHTGVAVRSNTTSDRLCGGRRASSRTRRARMDCQGRLLPPS